MGDTLRLHHSKGLNPHLTVCKRCGENADEIIMLGAHNHIGKCRSCDLTVYGGGKCPKCGTQTERIREIAEYEKLPAVELCNNCKKELADFKAEVSKGGVYFKCPADHRGVIVATHIVAIEVRKTSGIAAPDPVGVELTTEQCPYCNGSLTNKEEAQNAVPVVPEN